MVKIITYSDVNQDLNTNYRYDIDSIKQSITNLFSTRKGEREFLSQYGCDLEDYLFEIIDEQTAFLIRTELIDAINIWEPRVTIDQSKSYVTPDIDNHRYNVYLSCVLLGLNSEQFTYVVGLSK